MKAIILLLLPSFICLSTQAQTWEWVHAEPNGPRFYTAEDDAAHHIKTDAAGNVYVLGSFISTLYLNNNAVITDGGSGSYLAKYNPSGDLLWYKLIVADYSNSAGDAQIKASDLVVNSSGVYVTGRYNYTYGASDPNHNCTLNVSTIKIYKIGDYTFTSGMYDIGFFLAKLSSDGNVIWNKTATDSYIDTYGCLQPATCSNCGSSADIPVLTSDANNNLTVAFTYSPGFNLGQAGLVFDGTPVQSTRTSNNGGRDLILINLNSDGNYRWSNTAFTNPYFLNNNISGSELECNSIVADNNGNVFITGQAGDHAAFGTDVINTTPAGGALRYIAKLSSTGSWVFEKTLTNYTSVSSLGSFRGYSMDANPNLLTVDQDNNIYMLVNISKVIGESQYILGTMVYVPALASTYLLKMTNSGDAIWVKQFGFNTYNSSNYAFGISYANNNLYVTGALNSGRVGPSYYQFDNLAVPSSSTNNSSEYLVARTDINGNFKWANTFNGFVVGGYSLAINGDNIYTGGIFGRTISSLGNFNMDVSSTTDNYTSDIFFGKIKDQYIHVGAVSPTILCAGSVVNIPFTSYGLALSNTNTFTAQLSDANGDFTNAINIGTTTSTGSGSITATLPANLPMGSNGYKIRIVSSDLLNTGLPYHAYADINYSITVGNQTFYADADGDGYGNPGLTTLACTAPQGYVSLSGDCNDVDASIHPNATEVCDGKDNDCNGQVDDGLPSFTYYRDADQDGFGDANASTITCSPTAPAGYVSNSSDCDDTKKLYQDNDRDGYGSTTLVACAGVLVNTDCNDNNANINPGMSEVCGNGIDDNCDGQIDENCVTNTPPSITIQDKTVSEAQGVVILTINLSKASTQSIKINYATLDGTATSKGKLKDFTPIKGSLIIPAGATSGTMTISINNDGIAEPTEYFDVQLSLARNAPATIVNSTARITILDGAGAATTLLKSISPNSSNEEFLVKSSPNPSSGSFNLYLKSTNNKPFVIIITDALGRRIESRFAMASTSNLQFGNNYQQGIYFVQIIQGDKEHIIKLLKVH